MTATELTGALKEAVAAMNEMIARRMEHTDETFEEAREHLVNYLKARFAIE